MICKDFILIIPAMDPLMDANGNVIPDQTPVMATIALINGAVYFLPHIMLAVSLFSIARRRELPCAWLSWVPFANYWVMGCIADDYRMRKYGWPSARQKWLAVISGMVVALMLLMTAAELADAAVLSVVCMLLLLVAVFALNVAAAVALHDLYQSCDPKTGALFLILSVLVWNLQPLLVFLCRKKDGGIPE